MNGVMKFEIKNITPDQAKQWLRLNLGNRKLNKARVAVLAEAIKRGEWRVTHQGIAFAPDGRLLDGQHRLAAIVAANETVQMAVIENVSDEAFIAMDVGRPRTAADVLHISTQVAAISRMTLGILEGYNQKSHFWTVHQIQAASHYMKPWAEGLFSFCGTKKKARSAVPICLAVIARMAQNPSAYQWLGEQYRAFVLLDFQHISLGPQALLKQLDRGYTSTMRPDELLLRAFSAFDPKKSKKEITKIHASESDFIEIKEILQRIAHNFTVRHHEETSKKLIRTTIEKLNDKKSSRLAEAEIR